MVYLALHITVAISSVLSETGLFLFLWLMRMKFGGLISRGYKIYQLITSHISGSLEDMG